MKIGVKTFDSEEFLKYFEDKADFFEVQAIQSTPESFYSSLKQFSIPLVVHSEHYEFGINPADSSRYNINLKSINFARKLADSVKAEKIIIHPGAIETGNKNCSLENAVAFIKNLDDERLLVENLPGREEGLTVFSLCNTSGETKQFLELTGAGFCFDVNHAILSESIIDNSNYQFLEKYIHLKPKHYHIGGQRFGELFAHLCLADSDLDLGKILKYYPDNAEIILETEVNIQKVQDDVNIIRKAIKSLGK